MLLNSLKTACVLMCGISFVIASTLCDAGPRHQAKRACKFTNRAAVNHVRANVATTRAVTATTVQCDPATCSCAPNCVCPNQRVDPATVSPVAPDPVTFPTLSPTPSCTGDNCQRPLSVWNALGNPQIKTQNPATWNALAEDRPNVVALNSNNLASWNALGGTHRQVCTGIGCFWVPQ